jgi:hypothetical protein
MRGLLLALADAALSVVNPLLGAADNTAENSVEKTPA